MGICPGASNGGFGMEGQLRPGLRAEEEVVRVVVLELTVVLEEDVEEDEVVAGADGVCTSFDEESTLRCIFSTLTAGVRLEEKVTEMKRAARRKLRVRNTEPMRNTWLRDRCACMNGAAEQNTQSHSPSFIAAISLKTLSTNLLN